MKCRRFSKIDVAYDRRLIKQALDYHLMPRRNVDLIMCAMIAV